jgi:hypothetical protein
MARSYITPEDIEDQILACAESDAEAANAYIEWAASVRSVTPERIPLPAPFAVKRLGVCFACYNRALLAAGTDPTAVFQGERGQEGRDIYEQKRKMYREELERLLGALTAEDFTGERRGGGASVSLWRA